MSIFTFVRNLRNRKVTGTTILHEPNAIEENIESSLANDPNDTTISDESKDRSKRLPCRSTSGSQGISSPSQLLPPTPFNTPKKKQLRRSIRDHILGDNGTVVFVNEIVASSPPLDCTPKHLPNSASNLPSIYAAQMGLHSSSPASSPAIEDLKSATSIAVGASSVNPGHEALNVLNQLGRSSHFLPTPSSRISRSAELKYRAVHDQVLSGRTASATMTRTTGPMSTLSHDQHDNPARGYGDRSTGRSERHCPDITRPSPTARYIDTTRVSNDSLPSPQSPSSTKLIPIEREKTVNDGPQDESVEEWRRRTLDSPNVAGEDQAGAYAHVYLDVYDRLWLDAQRRKHHESTCCCPGGS